MGFQIKNSTFLNRKTKEKQDKERYYHGNSHGFFEEPENFEKELKKDLFKDLERKKYRTSLR